MGVGAYIVTLIVVRRSRDLDRYRYLLLLGAVVLMLSPLVPHLGAPISTIGSTVKLWVRIGPINGQPIELAKLALCIFFASYFVEKRELLSVPTFRLGNRLVLDPRPLVPILVAWGFTMLVLGGRGRHRLRLAHLRAVHGHAVAGHVGPVELYVVVGLVLFAAGAFVAAVSSARWTYGWRTGSIPGAAQPSYGGQIMCPASTGMGSGRSLGTGLGFGLLGNSFTRSSPRCRLDYIFAAFGTEMGLLGTTAIVFAFMLIVGAGLRIAQTARSEFARWSPPDSPSSSASRRSSSWPASSACSPSPASPCPSWPTADPHSWPTTS